MSSSSAREKTRPVGLFGVFTMIALVREVNARRSSSGSNVKLGGRSGTKTGVAPQMAASGP